MKKAGILTFHNAENYGAALQTYALMKAVQNLGLACEVIDYHNRGVFLRNAAKNAYYLLTGQNPIKNHQAYRHFRSEYLRLSKKTYRKLSGFQNDADDYDILIFGSDQIWNPDLSHGFDPLYFGQFPTRAKKIAYAASVGKDMLTSEEQGTLNRLITNFDAVAVREETMLPLIDQPVSAVVDPCMLLSADQWDEIASRNVQHQGYLLIYQLFANQNFLVTAKRLAQHYQKDILLISPYLVLKNRKQIHKIGQITPNEFLAYYKQADMVLSDSFHGTIFGILFEKPFFTILPNEKTSRITSLLNKLNLTDRIVREDHLPSDRIDFPRVHALVKEEVDHAVAYLEKHLT